MARHAALGQLETDQPAAHALALLPFEQRAVDEVAVAAGLGDPAQTGLDGRRRIVDVVAVKAVAHFEPQRVARAEPDILQPVSLAGLPQRFPQARSVLVRYVDFASARSGVARCRYDSVGDAGDLGLDERIIGEFSEVGGRAQALDDPHRQRSLNGQLGDLVRCVVEFASGPETETFAGGDQMVPVFLDVGRVDDEQVGLGVDPVDQNVVDDAAPAVRQAGILYLAVVQRGRVVAADVAQQVERPRPLDPDLAHVAHVEHAGTGAHGRVLVVDPGEFDRHVVAGEPGHPRAVSDMIRSKGSRFHREKVLIFREITCFYSNFIPDSMKNRCC